MRLRRSMLIVPGSRPERIAKAAALACDCVVMDIEDGVAPAQKPVARRAIADALGDLDFRGRERLVRINAVGTAEYAADLETLDVARIDALFVPKVDSGDQLRTLSRWLDAAEQAVTRDRPIDIVATIETPRGLLRALEIADASPRTSALFFGSGDYTVATGSAVTERALAFPRATIVAAAAAANLQAIDAAYFANVKDIAATRADAALARELGFCGKLLFHPDQIAPANEIFSPSPAEIARAERIIAGYQAAKARGDGTAIVDGEFIAVDIMLMAERVLTLARQIAAPRTPTRST
ncbi:MAG: HpcH/HpaI aldolase/citrate lyase family protein [Hyphomicrobiaceae bacterium]